MDVNNDMSCVHQPTIDCAKASDFSGLLGYHEAPPYLTSRTRDLMDSATFLDMMEPWSEREREKRERERERRERERREREREMREREKRERERERERQSERERQTERDRERETEILATIDRKIEI